MNENLKRDTDALWADVIAKAGMLERRALKKRQELFYNLIATHFGPTYAAAASAKEVRI